MTLRNPANLKTILDHLARSNCSLTAASAAIGGSSKLLFSWFKKLAAAIRALLVGWPSDADDPQFVKLVALARRMWTVGYEHLLRSHLTEGVPRLVIHDGEPHYVRLDPIER